MEKKIKIIINAIGSLSLVGLFIIGAFMYSKSFNNDIISDDRAYFLNGQGALFVESIERVNSDLYEIKYYSGYNHNYYYAINDFDSFTLDTFTDDNGNIITREGAIDFANYAGAEHLAEENTDIEASN